MCRFQSRLAPDRGFLAGAPCCEAAEAAEEADLRARLTDSTLCRSAADAPLEEGKREAKESAAAFPRARNAAEACVAHHQSVVDVMAKSPLSSPAVASG